MGLVKRESLEESTGVSRTRTPMNLSPPSLLPRKALHSYLRRLAPKNVHGFFTAIHMSPSRSITEKALDCVT
jgi:hypothetical protein